MTNDCFRYGINDGCNKYCPVLLDGECELANDENLFLIREIKMEKILENIKLFS